jgi:hypothetical protein
MGRESLAQARRDHDAKATHGRIFQQMARVAGLAPGPAAGDGKGRAADLLAAT